MKEQQDTRDLHINQIRKTLTKKKKNWTYMKTGEITRKNPEHNKIVKIILKKKKKKNPN